MKTSRTWTIGVALLGLCVPACHHEEAEEKHEATRVVVTSPMVKDVVLTQEYVCQIHSRKHIQVLSLENGYLEEIKVKEGQAVKAGDVLFQIRPVLFKAKLDAEAAKVRVAQLNYNNAAALKDDNIVSPNAILLLEAELKEAQAKLALAEAEYDFTSIKAPFDGIINTQLKQEGSLIKEGEELTTLSDNNVMWVYYNVPEKDYLRYKAEADHDGDNHIELVLADGGKFGHEANGVTVEGDFNNETGNIAFRADFPNPAKLLRHGQTGTVLINRTLKDALVIPQRATYEILDKKYVYVVDNDGLVRQRLVTIAHEKEDIYVVGKGLAAGDKIVLEGVRQVRDGEKTEFEFKTPEEALSRQKFHAE